MTRQDIEYYNLWESKSLVTVGVRKALRDDGLVFCKPQVDGSNPSGGSNQLRTI